MIQFKGRKKMVNFLVLSFIIFSFTSGQRRKRMWFLFVSVKHDCSWQGAAPQSGIVTVQVYLVIILDYTGCYEVGCPVVTKESVT